MWGKLAVILNWIVFKEAMRCAGIGGRRGATVLMGYDVVRREY